MSDIPSNGSPIDKQIQEEIQLLYPLKEYPPKLFPTLLNHIKTSFYKRLNPSDKIYLYDQSVGIKDIIQKYCSLECLIKHDPNTFILIYLPMIRTFVKRSYIYQFRENYEDVVQELIFVLLTGKLNKIWSNYMETERKVGFSSYFAVSLRYTIANITRKLKSKLDLMDQEQLNLISEKSALDFSQESVIEMEMKRFNTVLSLYYQKRPKLELLLKLHFKIPVSNEDILRWTNQLTEVEHQTIKDIDFRQTRGEIFKHVTPMVNRIETKKRKPGALIRWTQIRVKELITLMNKFHETIVYDSGTFETLISLYYFKYAVDHSELKK